MCREDLRIGRKKATSVTNKILLAGTDTIICAPANNRTHLSVHGAGTTGVIYPSPLTAGLQVGYPTGAGQKGCEVDVETHGNIVTVEWRGTDTDVQSVVMVIETFFDDGVYP